MKKRIVLFALLFCILIPVSGCASRPGEETVTTAPQYVETVSETEAVTVNPYDDGLGSADMQEFEMIFFNYTDAAHSFSFKQLTAEINGERINDAIYQRNKAVEERFNCKITEKQSANPITDVQNAVMSGEKENIYDIVMVYDAKVNQLNLAGCLRTWDTMTYCDLSKPWWNADANKCFILNGKQFGAVGDFCLSMYSKNYCYYFNKDMLKTVDLGYDIYQLVRDGKWTISKMLETGSNFTYDLDGDSVMGPADSHGIAGTTKVNFQMMITGSGIKFVDTNAEGNPYFTLSSDTSAVEKLSKIIDLYKSSNAYYNNNTDPSGGIVPTEFDNGTVFMLASTIWNITDYRDNSFKVGVMPSPKFDENQEKYYSVSVGGVIPLIPKVTTDERAGNVSMILEGMSSYSAQYLVPVYKEEILQAKYADAPDDSDMIDLIFRTQTFDFGVMVWAYDIRTPLMKDIFHTLSPNIASYLKQLSKAVDAKIKVTITQLQ